MTSAERSEPSARREPPFAREYRTLRDVVRIERTHPLELLGGFSALIRGVWVFTHPEAVHGAPVSVYLEAWFPVEVWGAAVTLGGLVQVYAVARDDDGLRRWANTILIALVGAILLGYLVHERDSIAIPLYVTMFLKQLWVGMRVGSPENRGRVTLLPRNGPPPNARSNGE